MKWLKKPRARPVVGDVRYRTRFAFLPWQDRHGVMMWLERMRVKQEYGAIWVSAPERPAYESTGWRTVEVEHLCAFKIGRLGEPVVPRGCLYCGKQRGSSRLV